MQKGSMLILIGIVTILLSSTYVILHRYFNPPSNHSFASVSPLIRQIMVVDVNQIDNFTAEAVLAGHLPILGLNENRGPINYQTIQLGFLDKIGRLLRYAHSTTPSITEVDPIFSRLVLVYMKSKKISHAVLIDDSGIRAIYLDPNHRVATELFPEGPKGYWEVVNTAVFADGSKRKIRVIPINSNDLPYP